MEKPNGFSKKNSGTDFEARQTSGGVGGRRQRRRRRDRRQLLWRRIEAGLMGWGGSGRRYLKAAPGRCPARVRPEVGFFSYSARKKNKKKY